MITRCCSPRLRSLQMDRTFTIILNPVAGKGTAGARSEAISSFFSSRGLTYSIVHTQYPGHAKELASSSIKNPDCTVIAAGGDGTCNEVINGLLAGTPQQPPRFGVLPIGSGNDFSFGAGLPLSLNESLHSLLTGRETLIDAGWVSVDNHERVFFINGCGMGFDARVTYDAGNLRHLRGAAAYIYAAVKNLIIYPPAADIEVLLDDFSHRGTPALVCCMIGRRLGGSFLMAPRGDNKDGLFDVYMTHQHPRRIKMIGALLRYKKGTQDGHKDTIFQRTNKISIRAVSGVLPIHADGETISTAGKQMEAACMPGALRVIG